MTNQQLIRDLKSWIKRREDLQLNVNVLKACLERIERLDLLESVTKEFTVK